MNYSSYSDYHDYSPYAGRIEVRCGGLWNACGHIEMWGNRGSISGQGLYNCINWLPSYGNGSPDTTWVISGSRN